MDITTIHTIISTNITTILTIISTNVAIGGGLWALYSGLKQYKHSQELRREELEEQHRALLLKRQELLFPMINEFDSNESIFYAKELLDYVPIHLKR